MRDAELVFPQVTQAALILPNMRGGCVTVGNKVHTLFRLTSRPVARASAIHPAHTYAEAPAGGAGEATPR